MCSAKGHVRFTPESGHVRCTRLCPLWAKSGHSGIHSITWSARPSNGSGMARPRVLAVFRLMTSSTLVACWTGRLAGFSPLIIRPGVYPEQTVRLREIGSVAHEPAGDRKLAVRIYG